MSVFRVALVKYVKVETSYGDFLVCSEGQLTRWSDDAGDFTWFDEDKYSDEELDAVRTAAKEVM